jgi:hypothetical protein
MRDERERRDRRGGLKTEVFGTSKPDLRPSDRAWGTTGGYSRVMLKKAVLVVRER